MASVQLMKELDDLVEIVFELAPRECKIFENLPVWKVDDDLVNRNLLPDGNPFRFHLYEDIPDPHRIFRLTITRSDGSQLPMWYSRDLDYVEPVVPASHNVGDTVEMHYCKYYALRELYQPDVVQVVLDKVYPTASNWITRRLFLYRRVSESVKLNDVFRVRYIGWDDAPVHVNLNAVSMDSTMLWKETNSGADQLGEIPEDTTPDVLRILGFDQKPKESSQLLAEWLTSVTNEGVSVDSFRGEGESPMPDRNDWV